MRRTLSTEDDVEERVSNAATETLRVCSIMFPVSPWSFDTPQSLNGILVASCNELTHLCKNKKNIKTYLPFLFQGRLCWGMLDNASIEYVFVGYDAPVC